MGRKRAPKKRNHSRRRFSLLVDWGRNHRALGDCFELIEGPFTLTEAEGVCQECHRLGAVGSSVHSQSAARKLFESNPRGAIIRRMERIYEASLTTEGGVQMPRVIEVIVAKDGGTTILTRGYNGASCIAATDWIEKSLGVVAAEQKTAEFFQTVDDEQKVQQAE